MLQPLVKTPWDGIAEQIWEDIGVKYQSDLARTAKEAVVETTRTEDKSPFPLLLPKPSLKPQAVSPGTGFTSNVAGAEQQGNTGVNCLPELILILQNLLKTKPNLFGTNAGRRSSGSCLSR